MTIGDDDDRGAQLHPLGHPREPAEHGQGLVEGRGIAALDVGRSTTYRARLAGSARGAPPPMSMRVRACGSSAGGAEARGGPRSLGTVWLPSRRVVASARQARDCLGCCFEATMMVLPEWSR